MPEKNDSSDAVVFFWDTLSEGLEAERLLLLVFSLLVFPS